MGAATVGPKTCAIINLYIWLVLPLFSNRKRPHTHSYLSSTFSWFYCMIWFMLDTVQQTYVRIHDNSEAVRVVFEILLHFILKKWSTFKFFLKKKEKNNYSTWKPDFLNFQGRQKYLLAYKLLGGLRNCGRSGTLDSGSSIPRYDEPGQGTALCSWAGHITLIVPLFTQVYKWVLVNLLLGVTLGWTSIPSRAE